MRVWDLPPSNLCNRHLNAQHNEIHSIYSIITNDLSGFSHHPEVERWRGHLGALYRVHERTVVEMVRRGYNHNSELPVMVQHLTPEPEPWQSIEEQVMVLYDKGSTVTGCDCYNRIMEELT